LEGPASEPGHGGKEGVEAGPLVVVMVVPGWMEEPSWRSGFCFLLAFFKLLVAYISCDFGG